MAALASERATSSGPGNSALLAASDAAAQMPTRIAAVSPVRIAPRTVCLLSRDLVDLGSNLLGDPLRDADGPDVFHRGLAERNSNTARIRTAKVSNPYDRTIDGVRVMQIDREVVWVEGRTTYSIEARLIGPDKSFSLVSDSPKAEWTKNNFEDFLRRMIDIAGIKGR